jgi:hypothetical protein
MDEKTFNLLKNYSEEISSLDRIQTPHGALSFLVQLIESHRYLRKMNQKSQAELHADLDKIRKMVHDAEMSSTWVKWETLRSMTLNDIINAIGSES